MNECDIQPPLLHPIPLASDNGTAAPIKSFCCIIMIQLKVFTHNLCAPVMIIIMWSNLPLVVCRESMLLSDISRHSGLVGHRLWHAS